VTGGARSALVSCLVAAAALVGGPRAARAQYAVELAPMVGIGYTSNDNANVSQGPGNADEYLTFGGMARLRYKARRADHSLSYRVAGSYYRGGDGPSGISQQANWLSAFNLTGTTDLSLGANFGWARTTQTPQLDSTNIMMMDQLQGTLDSAFVTGGATQTLTYQPSPRYRYIESARFATVHYLGTGADSIPATSNAGVLLRGEYTRGRDNWSLQLDVSDSFFVGPALAGEQANTVLSTVLLGWGRDLSTTWSFVLQAGAMGAFDLYGDGVIGPAFQAALNYKQLFWYATLSAGQQLAPNLFLGTATINDQVLARATVPLTRTELLYLIGFGGYTYARLAGSATGQFAYDVAAGGLALTMRSAALPFWASLDATYNDQRGNQVEGGGITNERWATVMLTVGAAFAFGPDANPIVGGRN
jgi:hypothetical protein